MLLALSLAACRPSRPDHAAWQQGLDAVVAAERAFARLARDSTVQHAFETYVDPAAVLFRPDPVRAGPALAREPFPAGMLLEWEPTWADAARDGSAGFTTGPWRAGTRGTDPPGAHGRYATVWRRQADGEYRAILDFGTANPEQPADTLVVREPPAHVAASPEPAQSVTAAETRLARALLAGDPRLLSEHFSDDARFLRDGVAPRVGSAAAAEAYAGPLASAIWSAADTDAADSGDLAWAWGTWTNAENAPPRGAWLRVWRRTSAGMWTVLLDAVTGPR